MNSAAEILGQENRYWRRNPPATATEIEELLKLTDFDWPIELLDLWRYSNGGEGELALPPMWFLLYSTSEVVSLRDDEFCGQIYKDYQFFGSNGGGELIGFKRPLGSRGIVMLDMIAGDAIQIADNPGDFIEAIGLEFVENA